MTNIDPNQAATQPQSFPPPAPNYQPPPNYQPAPGMPGPGMPYAGGYQMQRRVGKTRNPWGVWGLTLITFGIYGMVWYYKVNRETHDFDPSIQVSPGVAVLAMFFGISSIVSIVNTGGRIARAQASAGLPPSCSGGLGILFAFLLGLYPMYYQDQLNKVWAQYGSPAEGTVIG